MQLNKYHRALILPIALFLVSCSAGRNLTSHSQNREEIKALAEEVGRLEESLLSIRTEIRQLGLDSVRKTDLSETEDVETVTETFDTDKPTDPVTGTPPLQSRTTERRGNRRESTANEYTQITSTVRTEDRDTSRTVMESEHHEVVESETESAEDIREETQKKGLSWGQKTLMYAGIAALIYVAVRIFLKFYAPGFSGILSKIKQLLNSISR